tara:strand:+ start:302 stop:439 length:138 start_codon:yes stop_codon:yes gene_type:complete
MIIGATRKMIAVRVGVPLNRELLWALTVVIGEAHVGAAAQHDGGH